LPTVKDIAYKVLKACSDGKLSLIAANENPKNSFILYFFLCVTPYWERSNLIRNSPSPKGAEIEPGTYLAADRQAARYA
jgi:hypothetical protein